ncbi:hypothetical protein [Methanococcus maripaludis]|uniref:Uncharacterized protein n=1 Tax=Methanococcus maripaludis OS7 TaxID=637915 RepID=A0A2Z5PJR5_METMI|nr:hypothetical protein [Methanococcus maripaludis]BAP62115.1 hypothetical protein MMOS7_00290 [Methanococcus maripaludis OS7]
MKRGELIKETYEIDVPEGCEVIILQDKPVPPFGDSKHIIIPKNLKIVRADVILCVEAENR